MKFGVVLFPGSNCEDDTVFSLRYNLGQEVVKLWHKDTDLQDCDFLFLPGGFSYGDYLRSGAIARFSPIMNPIIDFANKGGKVMGICNGFQILVEAGLLPGVLLKNSNQKFICENVFLAPEKNELSMTKDIDSKALKIPIAHGDGRYFADKETLKTLNDNGQILFRYCDENGIVNPESNPNGSEENIAGICNSNRNVFGMMPHPERASDPRLGNTDGKLILEHFLQLTETV